MKDNEFIGKKVKIKTNGNGLLGVWMFDPEREYEIVYDRQNWLHIPDNRGLALCLCVNHEKNGVYAPGVEHIYEIKVIK